MNETITHRGALPQGTHVQEFEFLQVLGYGGFGITYKAWNTVLEKTVAIKEYMPTDIAIRDSDRIVHPKTDNDEQDFQWGLDRFLDEARMLARFVHPSIVQVQQFFEAKGTAYIVMEYLDGRTLGEIYNDHKVLNEQQLRILLEPILDALEQIHYANFLHRDIKPSNIVFRQDDVPVLIDFGAARAAIAMRSQSMTAVVTPGFSPIEQYSTSTDGKQGPWTDIYAVGVLLYRGMTGIVPSDATARIMDDCMVPIAEIVAERYSDSLIDAVDWALQMRVSDRPQSIEEWREVLYKGERIPKIGIDSKPVEIAHKSAESRLSGRMKWLISVGLVTVVAVGTVAYWWDELADQGSDEARRAELESALIEAERERSLLDGVARARALIAEGALVAARSAIEELVDQGLDEAGRAELESALAAKVSDRLARCEGHRQSERLAAALGCCREVLEYDENNGEASACIVRVSWLMVDDERTVEGYYRFEREYPESVFAGLARLNLEEVEVEYWRSIEASGDVSKYRRYLEIYPEGEFSSDARSRSSSQ